MIVFRYFQSIGAEETNQAWLAFLCILGAGIFFVVTDVLVRNKQITTISAIYFGLLLGLLLGNILSTALDPFLFWDNQVESTPGVRAPGANGKGGEASGSSAVSPPGDHLQRVQYQRKALTLLLTVICCYICISTLLQTKDEFRFIIPYVEFSKQVKGSRPLVLDTSVIIDGRIAD